MFLTVWVEPQLGGDWAGVTYARQNEVFFTSRTRTSKSTSISNERSFINSESSQEFKLVTFFQNRYWKSFVFPIMLFLLLVVVLPIPTRSHELELESWNKGSSVLSSHAFKDYDVIVVTPENSSQDSYPTEKFIQAQKIVQPDNGYVTKNPVASDDLYHQTQIAFTNFTTFRRYVRAAVANGRYYGRMALLLFPTPTTFPSMVQVVKDLYAEETGKNFDTRLLTFFVWDEEIQDLQNFSATAESLLRPFTTWFRINTEVFVVYKFLNEFRLVEFYSVRNASIVQSVDPCWSSTTEECYILSRRYERRKNFQRGTVKVTGVDHIWDQCVTTYRRTNGTLEFASGISVLTLWGIQNVLNFSIFAMESIGYIALDQRGRLSGVGGQLYRGEADLSITLEYLLQDRVGKITPLFPLFIDRARAYFQPPVELKNFYSSPFKIAVWYLVFVVSLVILLVTCFLSKAGSGLHERPWYSPESVLFVSVIFSQKGWYYDPPRIPGKVLLFTTLWLSVICFTAYSSSIISTLAVNIIPVKTFKDLVRHGFKLMYYPDHDYLFSQHDGSGGVGNISNHGFDDDPQAVERTITGGFIFLTTTDIFRPLSRMFALHERKCSSVSSIPFEKAPLQNSFFVKRGSPIKDHFNVRILQYLQAGLSIRYKKEQQDLHIVECPLAKSPQHTLEMRELSTAFWIFVAGTVSCVIVFVVEKVCYARFNRRTRVEKLDR